MVDGGLAAVDGAAVSPCVAKQEHAEERVLGDVETR